MTMPTGYRLKMLCEGDSLYRAIFDAIEAERNALYQSAWSVNALARAMMAIGARS